jgi:hypothetical protein
LAGDSELGATILVLVVGSLLCPLLVHTYIVSCGGSRIGGLAAAAVFLSWRQVDYFRTTLESVLFSGCLLLIGSLCAVPGMIRRRKLSISLTLASGFAFGLMSCTRGDGLPVGLGLVACTALLAPAGHRRAAAIWSAVGFSLAGLPLLVRNVLAFGSPMSPSMGRVFWVTEYDQWSAFGATLDPSLREMLAARYAALSRSMAALAHAPLVVASVVTMVLCIALEVKDGWRRTWASREEWAPVALPLLGYLLYNAAGIAFAPAITLWSLRSPITYLPLVLAGGWLAADRLLRRPQSAGLRACLLLALIGAMLSSVGLEPARLGRGSGHDPMPFMEAASRLPERAVAMTNAPMALYVDHASGVVNFPSNGMAAVASAIRHYDVEYLVLFDAALAWADELTLAVHAGRVVKLDGTLDLEEAVSTDSYKIYRVRPTASGTETPPDTPADGTVIRD